MSIINTILESAYGAPNKRTAFKNKIGKITAFATGNVDEMVSYLPRLAEEDSATFRNKPKLVRLITKRVLDEYVNGVSALPISRSVPTFPDVDLAPLTKTYDPQLIQTKGEIAGTVAVRPVYENGKVFYATYSAEDLIPVINEKTGELLGLGVFNGDTLEAWTATEVGYFRNGVKISLTPNPYGTIPFSIYKAGNHPFSWWGTSDLATIVDNNNTINKMLTDLVQLATDQSYSIFVYSGPLPDEQDRTNGEPAPSPIKIGTGRILTLPENGKLTTETPDASITEVNETVDSFTKGIYEDAMVFVLERNSEYSSGFSVTVKKGPYLRKMESKRKLFGKFDERLMELAVLAREVEENGPQMLNPEFSVLTKFDASSLTPETSQDTNIRNEFNLKNGVISPIDLIMEYYNVTREEAEVIYQRNIANSSAATNPPNGG